MEEAEALKRLRRGDEEALNWFVDRYAGYVSAIVRRIGGGRMETCDVEEAASDVFLTLWQNAEKVREGRSKAYLAGIARNKAKEKLRSAGRKTALEEDVLLISGEDVESRLTQSAQAAFLREAVMAMPQPDREIFLRYYYLYQPIADIAAEMKLNPATVKTRLNRGRSKLKEVIKKGGYGVEEENF